MGEAKLLFLIDTSISHALEAIHPIYFKYKAGNELGLPSDKEYVGIIAQDAKKAIPVMIWAIAM